jgi:hypothetical protein
MSRDICLLEYINDMTSYMTTYLIKSNVNAVIEFLEARNLLNYNYECMYRENSDVTYFRSIPEEFINVFQGKFEFIITEDPSFSLIHNNKVDDPLGQWLYQRPKRADKLFL